MVRAAVDGAIDFSQADLLDPRWHLRLSLVLNELVDRETLEYLRQTHQRHLAYLCIPGLSDDSWTAHQRAEREVYQDYMQVLAGSFTESKEDRKKQLQDALTSAWEREFGEVSDPATQIRIQTAATNLRLQREQGGS